MILTGLRASTNNPSGLPIFKVQIEEEEADGYLLPHHEAGAHPLFLSRCLFLPSFLLRSYDTVYILKSTLPRVLVLQLSALQTFEYLYPLPTHLPLLLL